MGTSFDRERGVRSGRIIPVTLKPSHGSYCFVLGRDGVAENDAARLTDGDYSEVSQLCNLDGMDVVEASIDVVGHLVSSLQRHSGLGVDDQTRFYFPMDRDVLDAYNWIRPGTDLFAQGDLVQAVETYSPEATFCRRVPSGSATGYLQGQYRSGTMPLWSRYTLQLWLNFLSSDHVTSWGISPNVFLCAEGPNQAGIIVRLIGQAGPGAHTWYFSVTHWNAGASAAATFVVTGPYFDVSQGWDLWSFVFDDSLAPALRLKLYQNDNPVPFLPVMGMPITPLEPAHGSPFSAMHPSLWGECDQIRMQREARTPAEIAADHDRCINLPPLLNLEWWMKILVDGTVLVERQIQLDEDRTWTDFKAPVRRYSGEHDVAFRLEHRMRT